MKSFLYHMSLGLLLMGSAALAHADEASKQAKIEEMLTLTHADRLMQQVLGSMQPMMADQLKKMPAEAQASAGEMQQKMMEWISSRLTWDKLKPTYIKIYSETFTEDEIAGVVTFYKSPAGQALLNKTPELMQKSMALMQDIMRDMVPEMQKMTEELGQKYKKQ